MQPDKTKDFKTKDFPVSPEDTLAVVRFRLIALRSASESHSSTLNVSF